jgi:DNA repair exonuclease SbcCD ATPase subunit
LQKKGIEDQAVSASPLDSIYKKQLDEMREKFNVESLEKVQEILKLKQELRDLEKEKETITNEYSSKLEISEIQIGEMDELTGDLRQKAGNFDVLREEARKAHSELFEYRERNILLETELQEARQKLKYMEADLQAILRRFSGNSGPIE